jgi:hypothetical protein
MKINKEMKKIVTYSVVLGFVLTLVSWLSSKDVPCSPMPCWGGTSYNGYPLKWYHYGAGDVMMGDEWLKGSIEWSNLLIDIIFWILVSLVVMFLIKKIRK